MAYLAVNSKFNPYTFDELLKPFAMYDAAYREQEALLDSIATEGGFSGDYLNQDLDRDAYQIYSAANDRLRAVSDRLATNGLSSQLRSDIRNTVRDYKQSMNTLNTAQAQLTAERDRRAKLGPDYVYQQDNLRIGDFLGGKAPNQKGESLKSIATDIAAQFEARARTISNDTWEKVLANGSPTGYYEIQSQAGLNLDQLRLITAGSDTWNSIISTAKISDAEKERLQDFRNVIASKKRAIGFEDYSTEGQYKIEDAILKGASAGLGATARQYKEDRSYSSPLSWANYKLSKDKFNYEKEQTNLALAMEEAKWNHEEGKEPSFETRTTPKEGYVYDSKGHLVHKDALSSGKTGSNKVPSIGVIHYNDKGQRRFYDSATQWNSIMGKANDTGKIVREEGVLSEENKRALAMELRMNPEDSDLAILEEAANKGIQVSVIEGNKKKGQQMILRGVKSHDPGDTGASESEYFNEDD